MDLLLRIADNYTLFFFLVIYAHQVYCFYFLPNHMLMGKVLYIVL